MADARPERVETGAKGKCGHGKYSCLRAAAAQRRSGGSQPGQSGQASGRIARTSPSRSTTEWRWWAAALNLSMYLMYVSSPSAIGLHYANVLSDRCRAAWDIQSSNEERSHDFKISGVPLCRNWPVVAAVRLRRQPGGPNERGILVADRSQRRSSAGQSSGSDALQGRPT